MIQLDIPYVRHSKTSKRAADSLSGKAVTKDLYRVLQFLRWSGPATDQEIQDGIPMEQNTERPRRIELVRSGFVADSGKTRKTRSGREATVWEATWA